GTETNSKSSRITRAKGGSSSVTARPLLHEHVVAAIDKAALVAECQAKDFCWFDLRPVRVPKPAGGGPEALVCTNLAIDLHPHPTIHAVDQCCLFRPGPLVHLAVRMWAADRNDPQAAARSDDKIEHMIGDRDPDAGQWLYHARRDCDEVSIHAGFDVHQWHDRTKILVRPIELIFRRWLPPNADREETDFAGTFDAWQIATQVAKFSLLFVQLLCRHKF